MQAAAVVTALLMNASAQDGVIFSYDASWRFNQSGTNLGTEWQHPAYDDSSWQSGRGTFGWPPEEMMPIGIPSIRTYLSLSNNAVFTRTFYFRKEFVFSESPSNVFLIASNVVDDGAVIYLNGVEFGRIGMAAGAVTNLTLASRSRDVSATGVEVVAGGTNLVQGTNYLAVELHQGSAPNSDVVFSMALAFKRATSPHILRQPEDVTIQCAFPPANFSVTAIGTDLRYQWYSNDFPVVGQTNSAFTLPITRTNLDNSFYSVVVSNPLAVVRSSNANLTVYPDTCGPRILSALSRDYALRSNEIDLTFDEVIAGVSANISNYQVISSTDTNIFAVTNAATQGAIVRLRLKGNLQRGQSYFLSVSGVADLRGNAIAPNTRIGISFMVSNHIFGMSQPWMFRDSFPGCPEVSPDWNMPSYTEDHTWGGPSPGIFWKFFSGLQYIPCTGSFPQFSELSVGCVTHYFRSQFQFPTGLPARVTLQLQHFVDDGAVFYLNGVEIARANLPAGQLSATTPAQTDLGPVCRLAVGTLTNILPGLNLLAVELHQSATNLADAVFGTELAILHHITPPVDGPPIAPLLAVMRAGTNIVLSWPENAAGFLLERADAVNGPWREAQPFMANPWVTPGTGRQEFYRLRWEPPP